MTHFRFFRLPYIVREKFVCEKCGNKDPKFIGYIRGKPYCRACISFKGISAVQKDSKPKNVILDLSYSLSKEQKELSDQIIQNYKDGIDTLVYAVCGSGKTEISYGIIAYAMSKGLNVGFALPRRDVVIELFYRLKAAFPSNKVVAVYGEHTRCLEGDLIILTTHQLYRYPNYFDLLVLDEIDAFPFKGDHVLDAFYRRSLRGHCLMMSATPSDSVVNEFKKEGKAILTLMTRFHKKPIPVPKIVIRYGFLKELFVVKKLLEYRRKRKQCFVFVPTVEYSKRLYSFVSLFVDGGNYVSSKREGRSDIISLFKKGRYRYLVTTAVLERGVTVKGIQVIIYKADERIYDSAALIQIAGRVGRKKDAANGDVIFLCSKKTRSMEKAIQEIKRCNAHLQTVLS